MTQTVRRLIAVSEILGGGLGLLNMAIILTRSIPVNLRTVLFGGTISAIFVVHVVAGALLWRDTDQGWWLSVIAQLAVLPRVVSSVVSLYFAALLDVTVGAEFWWHSTDPAFPVGAHGAGWWSRLWLGPFVQLQFGGSPTRVAVGLNLVALGLLVLLVRSRRLDRRSSATVAQVEYATQPLPNER
jgi:hypothetical protein